MRLSRVLLVAILAFLQVSWAGEAEQRLAGRKALTKFETSRLLVRIALLLRSERGITSRNEREIEEQFSLLATHPLMEPVGLDDLLDGVTLARLGAYRSAAIDLKVEKEPVVSYIEPTILLLFARERAMRASMKMPDPFTDRLDELTRAVFGAAVKIADGRALLPHVELPPSRPTGVHTVRILFREDVIERFAGKMNAADKACYGLGEDV